MSVDQYDDETVAGMQPEDRLADAFMDQVPEGTPMADIAAACCIILSYVQSSNGVTLEQMIDMVRGALGKMAEVTKGAVHDS